MKVTCDLKYLTTSQGNLGKALGISRQRANQLVKEGVVVLAPDVDNGQVLVLESVRNYYVGKGSSGDENSIDYMEEKAKHEEVKRKIAEIKLAKYEGSVYNATTVELVFMEMTSTLRSQLLGLPTKLAPIFEEKSKEEIYQLMTEEIEAKLTEMGTYNPNLFMEEVEEMDDEDSE